MEYNRVQIYSYKMRERYKSAETALETAITNATALKEATEVSTNGADVQPDKKWVTQAVMDTFTTAITTAETAKSEAATQSAIDAAVTALNEAVTTFTTAQKAGTKPASPTILPESGLYKIGTPVTITTTETGAGVQILYKAFWYDADGELTGNFVYTGADKNALTYDPSVFENEENDCMDEDGWEGRLDNYPNQKLTIKAVVMKGAQASSVAEVTYTSEYITVTFDTAGGTAVAAKDNLWYGDKITGAATTKAATQDEVINYAKTKDVEGWYEFTGAGSAFEGWYLDDEEWDLAEDTVTDDITLTAKWGALDASVKGPTAPDVTVYNPTTIEAYLDWINALPSVPGATTRGQRSFLYVLKSDKTVTSPAAGATMLNGPLYLLGLGAERTITAGGAAGVPLFTMTSGGKLTLGENITLKGGSKSVPVLDANYSAASTVLTMLAGSKITGNTNSGTKGAAVHVHNAMSFVMESGSTITGNTNSNSDPAAPGGVSVTADNNSKFVMKGGTIEGNTGPAGDVYAARTIGQFSLSGNAKIGPLTLQGDGASPGRTYGFTVSSAWNGSITKLSFTTATGAATWVGFGTATPPVKLVGIINNPEPGSTIDATANVTTAQINAITLEDAATHEISATGTLVAK
jgi:hypothetical protein